MAFSTSNVQRGSCGDMRVTRGAFTAGTADAAGTINLEGSQLFGLIVESQDASGSYGPMPCRHSVSGTNPMVVTVYNLGPVTSGRFIAFHK